MLTVSELYIYPIKSLGGIPLNTAKVTDRGFQYDRRWMLVDMDNHFLTQREHPQMALLKVQLEDDGLLVSHPAQGSVSVPFMQDGTAAQEVVIWNDTCTGVFVSPALDQWFSNALGFACRLVFMPDSTRRQVDTTYAPEGMITSFADAYPFLLIGQASLDDLNSRMETPLPINRFRPNIVFTGGRAFEEDQLQHMRIAGISFYGVKLCSRCVMTTVDQQTAKKGKEPLKTLSRYRSRDNKILFGQNLIHEGDGFLSIGDAIEVVSFHRDNPRFVLP